MKTCTNDEQETCEVEKYGCEGCYYNSTIEEDIKILEEYVERLEYSNMKMDEYYKNLTTKPVRIVNDNKELIQALQNLLTRYKELEERNKELLKTCYKYEDTLEHYEYKIFEELDDYIKLEEISKLDEIGIKGVKYIKKDKLQDDYIPITVIQNKINGYLEYDEKYKTCTKDGRKNYTLEYFKAKALQELLSERSITNDHTES